MTTSNVAKFVAGRQYGGLGGVPALMGGGADNIRRDFLTKQPTLLREFHFDKELLQNYDKVFASAWLDSDTVVMGTKNNKLLLFPASAALPPEAATEGAAQSERARRRSSQRGATGGCTGGRFVEIPLPDLPSSGYLPMLPAELHAARAAQAKGGIHSLAINPSRTLLVTGGENACDLAVFSLPTMEPLQLMVGHTDWVFGSAWVTDEHFISASRDKTVALWRVGEEGCSTVGTFSPRGQVLDGQLSVSNQPVQSRQEHKEKVRDVKYNIQAMYAATLSSDATVKLWDPHTMHVVDTVHLKHDKELVSIALQENLVAVGSQSHITLLDVRAVNGWVRCSTTQSIPAIDDAWGVRSMSMQDHLLTCGSGQGRISFLDLRKLEYLSVGERIEGSDAPPYGRSLDQKYLQSGDGYLVTDHTYEEHFLGTTVRNAAYTHAWDPSGTRLFVGGGPLPFGIRGSYMGLWQS